MMNPNRLDTYELFLFDLDGLLVDTEKIHYNAWFKTFKVNEIRYGGSFEHYTERVFQNFAFFVDHVTDLNERSLDWSYLRKEAGNRVRSAMENMDKIPVMEGAMELLRYISKMGKKKVVVTNSSSDYVDMVRKKTALADFIDHWIVREDYKQPKPNPECYKLAIDLFPYKKPVIGFEDSLKGLRALQETEAFPVWVLPSSHSLRNLYKDAGYYSCDSLTALLP